MISLAWFQIWIPKGTYYAEATNKYLLPPYQSLESYSIIYHLNQYLFKLLPPTIMPDMVSNVS